MIPMEMDLHIHTNRYSGCSNLPPSGLLRKAREAGLDGIALTEHGIRWSDDNTRPQCHDCNMRQAGTGGAAVKAEYRRNLIREIGEERVLAVEAAARRTVKIPTYLLAELLVRLREELKYARSMA